MKGPPLLASSDRSVFDGRSRSKNYGLSRSENDDVTASFPIKKIAFKVHATSAVEDDAGSNAAHEPPPSDVNFSARTSALLRQQEEFEAVKSEARAAGLRACRLAQMGIVPGVIRNDGETTTITCLPGSFGTPVADAKKGKKKRRKGAQCTQQQDGGVSSQSRGEEKVEIEEEGEDISGPFTLETRTTTPTENDNATTVSQCSKSSKSSKLRLFRKPPQKLESRRDAKSPDDAALEEAKRLLSSGAWMCGVCGTPFDTSDNASTHEAVCLVEWLKHDKLVRQGWREQSKLEETDAVPGIFLESKQLLNYPEYLPPRTGGEIPLSSRLVRKYLIMTDEALANVARRQRHILHEVVDRDLCALSLKKQKTREDPSSAALDEYSEMDKRLHEDLFVWEREYDALNELEQTSRDRHYYANLEQRAMEKRFGRQQHLTHHDYYYHRLNRTRRAGSEAFNMKSVPELGQDERNSFFHKAKLWGGIKGRFDHAYKLIKEGPAPHTDGKSRAQDRKGDKAASKVGDLKHDIHTLYINVVVKNSVQVVNNELQRIARGWWQTELNKDNGNEKDKVLDFQFEWIRAHTQKKVVRLAGIVLASDFTPRKVAVQLSNDLHRLLEPQLKHRGVSIQAVIEYREGQYFVLAVNIVEIKWDLLMQWVAKQWVANTWGHNRNDKILGAAPQSKGKKKTLQDNIMAFLAVVWPSRNEVVADLLYLAHRLHASFLGFLAVPLLQISYFFFKYAVNKFILYAVTDDICAYVEKKGMEMQLGIKPSKDQASFMLAALREIRSGGKKGSIEDGEEDEDALPIIGPLLGPAIKDDNGDAKAPPNFNPPDVLEFIGLETDLPVGFLRLRWALMHSSSTFLEDAFYAPVMNYDNIQMGQWSTNENEIGLPKTPDGIDEASFIGATLEYSYLMPKSAFVKANMCYATLEITHYDHHCLVIKEKTLTPEVPYGNTFISWTQYAIINTGKNTCRMVCSVEAEFPNGQPMVARQIKSGMRTGSAEKFVSLGETVCRYSDAYP